MKHFSMRALGASLFIIPAMVHAGVVGTSTIPTPTQVNPSNNAAFTTSAFGGFDWSDVNLGSTSLSYYVESSQNASTTSDGTFVTPLFVSPLLATSSSLATGTPEGLYYWHARAVDTLDNRSFWSSTWSFIIDNTTPTAPSSIVMTSSVAPVIGSTSTPSTHGVQNWSFATATDTLSGVALYQYNVTGTSSWVNNGLLTSFTTTLDIGSYTVSVRALDRAGNISPLARATVTVNASSTVATSTPSTTPVNPQDCKKGAWKQLGFRNQGKCVSFVEKMMRDRMKAEKKLREEIKKREKEAREKSRGRDERRHNENKSERISSLDIASSTSMSSSFPRNNQTRYEEEEHGNQGRGNEGNRGKGNGGH